MCSDSEKNMSAFADRITHQVSRAFDLNSIIHSVCYPMMNKRMHRLQTRFEINCTPEFSTKGRCVQVPIWSLVHPPKFQWCHASRFFEHGIKWLVSEKPVILAMSWTFRYVLTSKSSFALLMRCMVRYSYTEQEKKRRNRRERYCGDTNTFSLNACAVRSVASLFLFPAQRVQYISDRVDPAYEPVHWRSL